MATIANELMDEVENNTLEMNTNQDFNGFNSLEVDPLADSNGLTSTNIVERILQFAPEENELDRYTIKKYVYVVFMVEGNIGFLASYSENEPNSNSSKFGVSDLEEVNLKSIKADSQFDMDDRQQRRLISNPNIQTKFSYDQLVAINQSYVTNRNNSNFNYPCNPGLYLLTRCTKQWIRYTPAVSYGYIDKVLTMPLLASYHNRIPPSIATSLSHASSQTFNSSMNTSAIISPTIPNNGASKYFDVNKDREISLKYKDGFVTFSEKEYPRGDMSVEQATLILQEIILHSDNSPFKYFVCDGHRVLLKELNKLWDKFLGFDSLIRICPEYTQERIDDFGRSDSFKRSAKRDSVRALYTVIANHSYFHANSDIPNGSKEEVVRFRLVWASFYRTMMGTRPLTSKVVDSVANSAISSSQKYNALNHETIEVTSRSNHKIFQTQSQSDTANEEYQFMVSKYKHNVSHDDLKKEIQNLRESISGMNVLLETQATQFCKKIDKQAKRLDKQTKQMEKLKMKFDISERVNASLKLLQGAPSINISNSGSSSSSSSSSGSGSGSSGCSE